MPSTPLIKNKFKSGLKNPVPVQSPDGSCLKHLTFRPDIILKQEFLLKEAT